MLLAGVGERGLPAWSRGEIADRDVSAPMDFTWVDHEATTARQAAAVAEVAPVYTLDLAVQKRAETRVSQAFDMARRRYATAHDPAALAALRGDFVTALGGEITPAELDAIVATGFSRAVEDIAVELVGNALRREVVKDRTELPSPAVPITVLATLGDTRETRALDDLDGVHSVEEARSATSLHALERFAGTRDDATARVAVPVARAAIVPNLRRDVAGTEALGRKARESVGTVEQLVRRGTRIASKGDVLTADQVAALDALRATDRRATGWDGVLLWSALVGVLLGSLAAFAHATVRKFARKAQEHEAMLVLLVLVLLAGRLLVWTSSALDLPPPYGLGAFALAVPVAAGAVLVRVLVNSESALVWSIGASVLSAAMMDQSAVLGGYYLITSLVATRGVGRARERLAILRSGLQAGGVGAVVVLLTALLRAQDTGGVPVDLPTALGLVAVVLLAGLVNAIIAVGSLPAFEVFGFLTDHKLLELASLDHPLLRQLMLRAPGTYHHSVIVGTLSEAACEAIGANALLARVACYFHDIGKGLKPQYFVENQRDGASRHDRLSPEASAAVIIQHVLEGAALARQYKLPEPIIDNIFMHHGTGLIQYFHARAQEAAGPGVRVDEQLFRYPGPKPDTREAGVIMIADKVEAACRTIQHPSEDRIRAMIQQIIGAVLSDGQLEDCPLTLKELFVIEGSFTNVLMGIHHHRVEYPATRAISSGKLPAVPRQGTITLEFLNPFAPPPLGANERQGPDHASLPPLRSPTRVDHGAEGGTPSATPPPVPSVPDEG